MGEVRSAVSRGALINSSALERSCREERQGQFESWRVNRLSATSFYTHYPKPVVGQLQVFESVAVAFCQLGSSVNQRRALALSADIVAHYAGLFSQACLRS
jgi:hypothetical protein